MDSKQGVDEPLRIRRFEVGDLVFAKLKGYPPWPSKINQIESTISGGKEKTRYNVYFYGTHQSSILRSTSLFHYDTYAKAIVEKWGRKPKFHDALKELEREMMDKITYLNQLRTSTTTPDLQWSHGFNSACESLVHEIDGAQNKTKSRNHCKRLTSNSVEYVVHDVEDEVVEESRKLGYEVMYIERIPFPDTPESLIVVSLNYNKDWVQEEAKKIKEEERMMKCFVRIEPLPPQYAHLDQRNMNDESKTILHQMRPRTRENRFVESDRQQYADMKSQEQVLKNEEIACSNQASTREISDGSDEEAVETCPVCRLCFFSLADLKNHEKTVHGSVATAESMFDRLISNNKSGGGHTFQKKEEVMDVVSSWKEGYPLDSIIKSHR